MNEISKSQPQLRALSRPALSAAWLVGCILFVSLSLRAQTARPHELPETSQRTDIPAMEAAAFHPGQSAPASVASPWFDVTYYGISLQVFASPVSISGNVTIDGVCSVEGPPFVVFDLSSPMTVDSAFVDGRPASVSRQAGSCTVTLDSLFHAGSNISVRIVYHGTPVTTGLGSFISYSHSGVPWIYTLSEPYGARDWWPCKDTPADKADSADIVVTCDSAYRVGSNGLLTLVRDNHDGTATSFWKERYPIATYLVSICITNFSSFSNWFRYSPSESLEVLNYVLPEHLAAAQQKLPVVVGGLSIFSDLFGLYPFINEKYGHSEFAAGAMEHQTMTSTVTFAEDVLIHELAHQWFGDKITCRSWQHLWLNEGFATYCTALYFERTEGDQGYHDFMSGHLSVAKTATGTLFVQDTSDVRELFRGARVYSKGASVLHMLRHVLGDTLFFRAMKAYANDSSVVYGTATTEDFRSACERATGFDLGQFFNQWVYGENYPHYTYTWNVTGGELKISLSQSTGTGNPAFFTMPVDFRIIGEGWDTLITVMNDRAEQTISLEVPVGVDTVMLDPEEWILKDVSEVPFVPVTPEFQIDQNYPNPFNGTTGIRLRVPRQAQLRVSIMNLLGEEVAVLADKVWTYGVYVLSWDGGGLPSGVYFCRVSGTSTTEPRAPVFINRKILLVK